MKTIKLTSIEKTILNVAARGEKGRATLGDMERAFMAKARSTMKTKWHYSTEVIKESRVKWRANLYARNGIRKPVREGLLRKVKPGTYAITAAGRKAL